MKKLPLSQIMNFNFFILCLIFLSGCNMHPKINGFFPQYIKNKENVKLIEDPTGEAAEEKSSWGSKGQRQPRKPRQLRWGAKGPRRPRGPKPLKWGGKGRRRPRGGAGKTEERVEATQEVEGRLELQEDKREEQSQSLRRSTRQRASPRRWG